MFLLATTAGVTLGLAYARFVGRHLDLKDWRRWAALVPFWAGAIAIAIDLRAVNMVDPVPQALQAFAFATLLETVHDSSRALRRRHLSERGRTAARATLPAGG